MEFSQVAWLFGMLLLSAWYLSNVAGRLDRLHLKAEAARHSLDTQLAHRISAVARLLEKLKSQNYEVSKLDDIWHQALNYESNEVSEAQHWQSESDLTLAINNLLYEKPELLSDPDYSKIMSDLAGASRRVQYAKAFHNDAQNNALKVRQRVLVKLCRLAGRAKLPRVIEFDDAIAPALKNK